MRYSIGSVARILGLTPAALHYFEKEGVIAPRKGDDTRRYYSDEDVIRLISYKKYRSMDIPLKEIAKQFSPEGNTFPEIEGKLTRQREQAVATAERMMKLAEDIRWFEEAVKRSEGRVHHVDLAYSPESYGLLVGQHGFISQDRQEQEHVRAWLDCLPAARISVILQPDGTAKLGYSALAARAKELGLMETPGRIHLPSRLSLHTFVILPHSYYRHPEIVFAALLEQCRAHGFVQDGYAFGVNLCVQCIGDHRDTLSEVWLPVRLPT